MPCANCYTICYHQHYSMFIKKCFIAVNSPNNSFLKLDVKIKLSSFQNWIFGNVNADHLRRDDKSFIICCFYLKNVFRKISKLPIHLGYGNRFYGKAAITMQFYCTIDCLLMRAANGFSFYNTYALMYIAFCRPNDLHTDVRFINLLRGVIFLITCFKKKCKNSFLL